MPAARPERIVLIAAVARNGVIGRGNAMPWHLPEDLRHFKRATTGSPVVMGRRTWDAIGRPLAGRRNVVVTRRAGWHAEGAESAASLAAALERLAAAPTVFVIGGAQLYAEALPLADELLLTEIDADFEGDTLFPAWPHEAFVERDRERRTSAEGLAFDFVRYARAVPA